MKHQQPPPLNRAILRVLSLTLPNWEQKHHYEQALAKYFRDRGWGINRVIKMENCPWKKWQLQDLLDEATPIPGSGSEVAIPETPCSSS